jgi:hypothetical protein
MVKTDPLTTAIVALFEALAERDNVPVDEVVDAFIGGYAQKK